RDFHVTGVQTCALPICLRRRPIEEKPRRALVSLLEHRLEKGFLRREMMDEPRACDTAGIRDFEHANTVVPARAEEVERDVDDLRSEERRVGEGRRWRCS